MMLSSDHRIEIGRAEYESILTAVSGLLHCSDVEEKYDGIIENYRELESFIFDEALQSLFRRTIDDIAAQAPRSTTARKLSNFLSSVRLYADSIERHTKAILNDDSGATPIMEATSHEFDTSLNYRIMDGLRNYAQHRALPVHGYANHAGWDKDRVRLSFEFQPMIHVKSLADDPKFRKKTLSEIKSGPEMLELKPMVREYVESLSAIHDAFRELTSRS